MEEESICIYYEGIEIQREYFWRRRDSRGKFLDWVDIEEQCTRSNLGKESILLGKESNWKKN